MNAIVAQARLYAEEQSTHNARNRFRACTAVPSAGSVNARRAIAVVSMCGVRGDPNTIPLPAFHPLEDTRGRTASPCPIEFASRPGPLDHQETIVSERLVKKPLERPN